MPTKHEKTTKKQKVKGKLYPLNMRTSFELRQQLEAAAAESGRSLTREVEERLERSFSDSPVVLARITGGVKEHLIRSNVLLGMIAHRIGISPDDVNANVERAGEIERDRQATIDALNQMDPERLEEFLKQAEEKK